jgi:hypothetical protein
MMLLCGNRVCPKLYNSEIVPVRAAVGSSSKRSRRWSWNRQCRLIWLILHQGVRYEERGPAVTKQSKQKRTTRMILQLRSLGYRIDPPNPQPSQAQAQ